MQTERIATDFNDLRVFETLTNALPQIVWVSRNDKFAEFLSARWYDYTGLTLAQSVGWGWQQSVHPEDLPLLRATWKRAVSQEVAYNQEFRIRRAADGAYRWNLAQALPLRNADGRLRWFGTLTDIDDRKHLEVRVAQTHDRELRVANRLRTLADCGRALSMSLDLDVVLDVAVSALVPRFADWAILNLAREDGELVVAATRHSELKRDRAFRALVGHTFLLPGGERGIAAMLRTRSVIHLSEIPAEAAARSVKAEWLDLFNWLEPCSAVVVPLAVGGTILGTLNVGYAASARRYESEDLEFLADVGLRAAMTIENARRYERERRVAERYQRASLPRTLPDVRGVVLDAVYAAGRSEAQVGGDWYDAFTLADGRLLVSVGDVMGSGLEAAVLMGAVRQAIRGAAHACGDPNSVLNAVDRGLAADGTDRLVTAFIGILDASANTLVYASAGHPPPFIRTPDGAVAVLEGNGLPLGLRSRALRPKSSRTVSVNDGTLLVLYTDGLTEAQRDVESGERLLVEALANIPDDAHLAEYVRHAVLKGDNSQARDDIAILTVKLASDG